MDPLHSQNWHRVAELRPRVAAQARFCRHEYRGESWYVVRSPASGRVHRLTPAAYALVAGMDGERKVDELWRRVDERLGDDAPTQDETLQVLGLLHAADLLRCDVPPDTAELFASAREREEREARSRYNPIAFRVPLLDPDDFLTRFAPWLRPVFSPAGALVFCAVVLAAALAALRNAPELAGLAHTMEDPAGLLALWLAYPVIKGLHELGHAFAVKRWGGEVHELGILFLVFVPVPYVDASAASLFPEKSRRMIVGAAGIAVELFLAALACFVWLAAEPGSVRHVAGAVLLVGGLSTVLFNGNPLLRFDGYYVLADALEIPNLGGKADQYLGALARRWLLGLRDTELPETTPREPFWLVGYALAAWAYRLAVACAIAFWLAGRFFFLGVGLALFAVGGRVVLPLARWLVWLLSDPVVGERRGRALGGSLGAAAALAVLVFVLPLPLYTLSEGVVWLPERANVRAGTEGFVVETLATPNTPVLAGAPLLRIRDPASEARVQVLQARQRELELKVQALRQEDRVQSEIAGEELAAARAELERAREHEGEVLVRSPLAGTFVLPNGADPIGRYVHRGEVVAHVVDLSRAIARVVVTQQDVGLLRERTPEVRVRLVHDPGTVLAASIAREVPAASDRLPTRALGTRGGGRLAVDPADAEGLRTLEPVFQFDLALPADAPIRAVGERVYVRFDHGAEPLGARLYRGLRRAFLRQLGV